MLKEFTVASGKARLAGVQDGAADALRTPVIFLHAGVADGRMWQAQLDEFAPRHRVVAYDRRGFGKTRGQAETFSHIDGLLAVLDGLDIDQAALVGCSQGGRIAIDFALTHPGRAAGVFLVAPAVTGAPSPEAFPPAVEALLEMLEEAEEEEDLDRINLLRSEEHTSDLQSLMRISYAV